MKVNEGRNCNKHNQSNELPPPASACLPAAHSIVITRKFELSSLYEKELWTKMSIEMR